MLDKIAARLDAMSGKQIAKYMAIGMGALIVLGIISGMIR
jgi:hypothetical protein